LPSSPKTSGNGSETSLIPDNTVSRNLHRTPRAQQKGEPLLFQWSYRAFFNDEGKVSEYLAQGRDLSYVVRLDEILPHGSFDSKAESDEHVVSPPAPGQTGVAELANLADSLDQVQYPIFAIDKQGVVIAWNHAIAELTGIDARTIIGQGDMPMLSRYT